MTPTPDFGTGEQASKRFAGSNVEDLPVVELEGGHVSCWLLTDQDLATILATRRVYLWVKGPGHPPVFVTAEPLPAPTGNSAPRNGKVTDA